jgi:hypothetical protein
MHILNLFLQTKVSFHSTLNKPQQNILSGPRRLESQSGIFAPFDCFTFCRITTHSQLAIICFHLGTEGSRMSLNIFAMSNFSSVMSKGKVVPVL